jgi:NtrC-family two-component system sensor histidine kinase KinB
MSVKLQAASLIFRRLVMLAGAIALLAVFLLLKPTTSQPGLTVSLAVFIAFLVFFPLLPDGQTGLISIIALGGGLYTGPASLAWILALGVFTGYLALYHWPGSTFRRPPSLPAALEEAAFCTAHNILPLVVSLTVFKLPDGIGHYAGTSLFWPLTMAASLLFAGLHGALLLPGLLHDLARQARNLTRSLISLALIELLPLPFIFLLHAALPELSVGALLSLGALPAIFAVLLHGLSQARSNLERRLQDLSTLNNISRALRSTLDLEGLLTVIHIQVTQLLKVDNFYVALYNPDEERLWYPLAVKYGQRQDWPPRPLTDRLTDRVIRDSKPLLLPHHAQQELVQIGLPAGENAPFAWIGVPLFTGERAIGCLALFSLSPAVEFTRADLDLLTILSGQASVAIDNALLYEQTQRRTTQLETLNRLTGLISASLNPQDVLAQICSSVAQVGGGSRSAVFLLDPEAGQVWLAHAHGLSEGFCGQNAAFSLLQDARTRCLRTGMPVLMANLSGAALEWNYIQSITQEGIQAFGDFPLSTPDGHIGFLSVYYPAPHSFNADEIELLQTYASQAALAVSNARLHARTDMALARRAHQLSMLEAVGRELAAAISSDRLFDLIVDYALEFTNSPWGNLRLFDPTSNQMVTRVAHGYSNELPPLPAEKGIVGRAFRSCRVINVGDVRKDPDHVSFTHGLSRSQLSVPLIHQERVLGVLTVESTRENAFTAYDQSFLSQLSNQAAIAVVNAQLIADVSLGRDRLQAVLNSVNEGIMLVESNGRITLVNDALQKLTGLPAEAFIGNLLPDLPMASLQTLGFGQASDADALMALVGQSLVTIPPNATFELPAAKSARFLERLHSPVWGQANRVTGWVILLRDITEAERVNQTRELLTETLIHDLRSPISAVIGSLDILSEPPEEQADEEFRQQALRVARRSAGRVLNLVDSLLEIARLQSGKLKLILTSIQLDQVILQVSTEMVGQANEYGIAIVNNLPSDLPTIQADQGKIARVLVNLVENAIKFSPERSQVTLTAWVAGEEQIAVAVSDCGPGIPVEYREIIFERFSQIPGQHGRRRGAGLGLTFCRLAVEAHGGKIWVESHPAGGSTFTFTLPIAGPRLL